MKIAITGGSGFIGTQLTEKLVSEGHDVLILDQRPPTHTRAHTTYIKTDLIHDIPVDQYLSCDAVIHLAGANIFSRWTNTYKQKILHSRIDTAQSLINLITHAGYGPKVFISASAVGYYGDGGEKELNEESAHGDDFLASVCVKWEAVAQQAERHGIRTVCIRTGIVLGAHGGMLSKLMPIFKLGLGGRLGDGNQWFSWIFIEDLVNIYALALGDTTYSGPINAVSPTPVRNSDFTRTLGSLVHRPTLFPVPARIVKMIFGELGNVILMSQKVIPTKLLQKNFTYSAPTLTEALRRCITP